MFGCSLETLVDSGAGRSIMGLEAYKTIPDEWKTLKPNTVKLIDIHGNPLETEGTVTLKVTFQGTELTQDFIVTSGVTEDCILGMDAIITHKLVIHGGKRTVYIDKDIPVEPNPLHRYKPSLTLKERITIPRHQTVCVIAVRALKKHTRPSQEPHLFKSNKELPKGIQMRHSLQAEGQDGEFFLVIKNDSCETIRLKKGHLMGTIEKQQGEIKTISLDSDDAVDLQEAFKNYLYNMEQIRNTAHSKPRIFNNPQGENIQGTKTDRALQTNNHPQGVKRPESTAESKPKTYKHPQGIPKGNTAAELETQVNNDPQGITRHIQFLEKFMRKPASHEHDHGGTPRTNIPSEQIRPIQARLSKLCTSFPHDTPVAIISEEERRSTVEPVEKKEEEQRINVPPQYKEKLQQLLDAYPDLFASKLSELGRTNLVEHHIDTGDSPPKASRAYQANPRKNKEINDIVQELLECGHITPSMSPWASPVLLVPKKCGGQRFCIDYRKLNAVTKKDAFPLPRISSILDKMNGKKLFSSLDLFSGFWQIKLDSRTKEKTAFILDDPPSLYEWEVLSMGLANSPSTFQRLMLNVLRPVLGRTVYVYLDDILVFSDNLEDHLKHIREVFDLLRAAGLKLKLKKCEFLKDSVSYLGHIITPQGLLPDPSKIEKIANFPTPKSADEVRIFLGISGYYRSFIKDYGKIAQPLTAKIKKENTRNFKWEEEDQKAFEYLRTRLITSPILAFPNFELPFMLFCDASNTGLGVVLSQVQDGKEVVISYASRQLKGAEVRFSTTEKEALAVVFALKHYKHYLQYQKEPVKILSDHKPLVWLANQKDDTSRLGRWAMLLAGTNYEITYKPGRIHNNADTLSRIPAETEEETVAINTIRNIVSINILTSDEQEIESMERWQAKDDLCRRIRTYMEEGILSPEDEIERPIWVKEITLFKYIDGLIYREAPTKQRNHTNTQLVTPLALRGRIVKFMHNSATGGHFGYHRTYLKVAARFYWPEMKGEIKEYCRACIDCTANRAPGPRAFLKPLQLATRPNQILACDFCGPIKPTSPQGNKYIMVITDKFSKFVRLAALPNLKAETAAQCLMEQHVFNEGPPLALVSDKGCQFTSDLFRELCKLMGIKQLISTPYHPESDGATERMNRTMISILKKMLREKDHHNWEYLLGPLKMAYNDSIHSSTLQTPYYLEHGRDMSSILDTALELRPELLCTPNDYISELTERLRYSYHKVREAMVKARDQQKEQYDKRAAILDYKVGDKVLLDIRTVKEGECKKLTSAYTGPFRVIRKYDNMTVDIADNNLRPRRVHVNRLKPLTETVLWRDLPGERYSTTETMTFEFHKHCGTQTTFIIPKETLPTIQEEETQKEIEGLRQTITPGGVIMLRPSNLADWDEKIHQLPAVPQELSRNFKLTRKAEEKRKKAKKPRAKGKNSKVGKRKGRPKLTKAKQAAIKTMIKRPARKPKKDQEQLQTNIPRRPVGRPKKKEEKQQDRPPQAEPSTRHPQQDWTLQAKTQDEQKKPTDDTPPTRPQQRMGLRSRKIVKYQK